MPLVVGIDEAGYGPLLGPLVVGATFWRVTPEACDCDYWERLADRVSRRPERGETRLPVGDSKQIFDRKRGLSGLERTVLAFARVAGLTWHTLGEFLEALGYTSPATDEGLPWYRDLSPALPVDPRRSAYAGAAQQLRTTMQAQGLVCCGLRAEVVTEDRFNHRVNQTHNKAAVLAEVVLRLIAQAARSCGDQDLAVRVDRLGGRTDYRALLMTAFPNRHLHVVELNDTCSRYRLASQRNDWHISFHVNGDQCHLPVALASMLAKYVRELLMARFNAYWHSLDPMIKPTAGYYSDALRFLGEIGAIADRAGVSLERFTRAR